DVFWSPRPTLGHIRYLQMSAVQTVTQRAHNLVVPQVAVFLGALGIAMSGYSSRQLAVHHRPSTRILHWMSKPAINVDSPGSPGRACLASANTSMASIKKDEQDQKIKSTGDTEQPVKASPDI
uniref:Zgc:193593 n=1 Tax=Sinocyclocheilus anshuiensis TaxID=1608454 RepID=A0A671QLS3_9TELE